MQVLEEFWAWTVRFQTLKHQDLWASEFTKSTCTLPRGWTLLHLMFLVWLKKKVMCYHAPRLCDQAEKKIDFCSISHKLGPEMLQCSASLRNKKLPEHLNDSLYKPEPHATINKYVFASTASAAFRCLWVGNCFFFFSPLIFHMKDEG